MATYFCHKNVFIIKVDCRVFRCKQKIPHLLIEKLYESIKLIPSIIASVN